MTDTAVPSETSPETVAQQMVYTLVAAAFTEPQTERFSVLKDTTFQELVREAASTLEDATASIDIDELGPGEADPRMLRQPVSEVFEWLPYARETAMEQFAAVFGYTMAKDCPPHAVEYCPNTDMFYRSQRLADIAGFYRAFGIDRSQRHRDREDHVVYIAEFLAFLLEKAVYSRQQGHSEEHRRIIDEAFQTFFRDHCGWWWPAFARCVRNKAGDHSFYGKLAVLLQHLTAWQRLRLGLPKYKECPEPQTPSYEPEGVCFSCGVGSSSENESST